MKHLIPLTALGSLAAGAAMLFWSHNEDAPWGFTTPPSPTSVSQVGGREGGPRLKEETRRHVGVFDLTKGRKIRLSTADTVDGMACLIEEDEGGEGSSCLENGLFALRKVEFLVSSQGGPERFSELHVAGVAAPSIRGVSLLKTDGTVVELRLNAGRAFVFESPEADLEARTYPTALRLYGASGKLVETVTFPPAA